MSIRKNTPFNSPFWHVRKQSSSYAVGGNVIAHISIEGADYEHDATVWGWYSTRYKSHLFVHLQINSGVRTSPIYNALIFNNIKTHHVRTPWIGPNRGQSVIKQLAVHEKPLFRGQGLEKQLVIHKIPSFCGWGIEKGLSSTKGGCSVDKPDEMMWLSTKWGWSVDEHEKRASQPKSGNMIICRQWTMNSFGEVFADHGG